MQLWMHMVKRHFWLQKIQKAWEKRSIIWLTGVRRAGKTTLCQSLENVLYFDCELPRTRQLMEDPESFLGGLKGKSVVLDEIHRLQNPSELLKIAADHFPSIKIIATGSSTLGASKKFKDTLTGRKTEIWLTPMMSTDLTSFKNSDLKHRLKNGGLPPFFLDPAPSGTHFQEWMDSYWAKDIQELFHLERRHAFQRFLELLFLQSGGIFEANAFAQPCEISRTTVANYLNTLEATRVVHVIKPFSKHRKTEIVAAPKVYTFDTGFVCYYRRWDDLRLEDLGILWEHYLLNEIHAQHPDLEVRYWRDKQKHEVDFILIDKNKEPIAVECKWSSKSFDPASLQVFRSRYPKGENWVFSADIQQPFRRRVKGLELQFLKPENFSALF